MENKNPLINGLVYRDDDKIMFISFYDEKRKEIFENQYKILGPKQTPISESCFVLVEFVEEHYRIKTKPIIITKLHYNNSDIPAKKLSLDGLITASYDAAKKCIAKFKTEASDLESPNHHSSIE